MTQRFTKIDRAALQTIQQAAQKALEAVAEQYGLTITPAPGRYSNGATGQITFSLALPTADGQAQTAEEIAFKRHATLWGLTPEDLGETFAMSGKQYRITGANPKKPKYAILGIRVSDGKSFGFPYEGVRDALRLKRMGRAA